MLTFHYVVVLQLYAMDRSCSMIINDKDYI